MFVAATFIFISETLIACVLYKIPVRLFFKNDFISLFYLCFPLVLFKFFNSGVTEKRNFR